MRVLYNAFLWLLSLGVLGALVAVAAIAGVILYYGKDVPAYTQLKDYAPPIVTRVYASDGALLQEYAREKRIFIPIEQIPDRVKNAFIAAEDKNYYTHEGVDPIAIARAAVTNLKNIGTESRPEGASTITQQVVKNFLLSNEVSYERKVKEAILAYRLEQALGKELILELYLNQIYLGSGTYGVAAASLDYFNKPLEQLEIAEAAYLAGLPKAPSNYHPNRHKEAAVSRRNYVIRRMYNDGYITREEREQALEAPLEVNLTTARQNNVYAPYYAEEVRRLIQKKYGTEDLYGGGFSVHTPVDPQMQQIAVNTLRDGLMAYDKRHGWRGTLGELETTGDYVQGLKDFEVPDTIIPEWRVAAITAANSDTAELIFSDGSTGTLAYDNASWTGRGSITAFLSTGDIIPVERLEEGGNAYKLQQVPKVQGGLVAIDPNTGRVLAMQGGWRYGADQFNRATQAKRQPGSAFKPVVYTTALEKGFTPATLVLDGPFEIVDKNGDRWRPKNYSDNYYGPTPLRVGIEKSKNLMTVRLANYVGMDEVSKTAGRLGVAENMPTYLPNSLGSWETTLLDITTAYAILANGGKKLSPAFIDRIQNRYGETIYKHDNRECPDCGNRIQWEGQPVPDIPDNREQIVDPRIAYQMVSIMEGVVKRGTARRISDMKWPLAGKTGTTNESRDTWFIGYSTDLAVGVFIGFDDPKPMGDKETGSSVSLPVFGDFMKEALKDTTPMPFRVPQGIRQVKIDATDGTRAESGDSDVIWESFIAGTEPDDTVYLLNANNRIQRVPAARYRDNYRQMQDQYMRNAQQPNYNRRQQRSSGYNNRYNNDQRRQDNSATSAPSSGTGGLY